MYLGLKARSSTEVENIDSGTVGPWPSQLGWRSGGFRLSGQLEAAVWQTVQGKQRESQATGGGQCPSLRWPAIPFCCVVMIPHLLGNWGPLSQEGFGKLGSLSGEPLDPKHHLGCVQTPPWTYHIRITKGIYHFWIYSECSYNQPVLWYMKIMSLLSI